MLQFLEIQVNKPEAERIPIKVVINNAHVVGGNPIQSQTNEYSNTNPKTQLLKSKQS